MSPVHGERGSSSSSERGELRILREETAAAATVNNGKRRESNEARAGVAKEEGGDR